MGGQDFDWLSMIELTISNSQGSSKAQKISSMYFNSSFDNRNVWVCKKCINKVYYKFKSASNGIEMNYIFVNLWSCSDKILIFLIFGFMLRT
jgi:hypothetical protein